MIEKKVTREKNVVVTKLIADIYKKPASLNVQDIKDEVQAILEEEADFTGATDLAYQIRLEIPKLWYENCLKKAISIGDYFNTAAALDVLDRSLAQEEILELIEKVILVGDMKALHHIQEFSTETFSLAIWQNILIIRAVRLLWEKKHGKKSPLETLTRFSSCYEEIIEDFDVNIVGSYMSVITDKQFPFYDNYTMSQFLHCLVILDNDYTTKKIAREIQKNSPVS